MAGSSTNGLSTIGPAATYQALNGYERHTVDTQLANGASPQTVATTVFQGAALGAALTKNTATATSGAATLSNSLGMITSESLSTAAGASYTLTLTNTLVTAARVVQAAAYLASSTQGQLAVTSITPAAGSVVIVVKNVGTAALNGTIVIPFQVF